MIWDSKLPLPMQPFTSGSIVFQHPKKQNSNLVSELPEAIHSGLSFFEACLEEKVIIVPGTFQNSVANINPELGLFFDINPKNRRDLSHSPCHHFIRYDST